MLYWMCDKTKREPNGLQLEHALRRNFGGLEELRHDHEHAESRVGINPIAIFKKYIDCIGREPSDMTHEEISTLVCLYASASKF